MKKMRTWVWPFAVLLLALVMVFTGCPNGNDDGNTGNEISADITIANAGELTKIAEYTGDKGGSADNYLYVKLTETFNNAEFAKLSRDYNVVNEDETTAMYTDPINGLFAALTKFVYLDMSDSTWTGYDDMNILMMASAGVQEQRTTRDNLVGLVMPRTIKNIGAYLFTQTTGLRELSFNGCSNLEEIGRNAFDEAPNLVEVDFIGCSTLRTIQDDCFRNNVNMRSKDSADTLDMSALTGLELIRDRALGGVAMERLIIPATNSLAIGSNTLGNNLRWIDFKGYQLIDFAWGNTQQADTARATLRVLPITHIFPGDNNVLTGFSAERTDRVMEFFFPESLSSERAFQGYLYKGDDDGKNWGSLHIPLRGGEDIYRGQASMTIRAKVEGALSGTVNLYSQKTEEEAYRIGAMAGGIVTLNTPQTGNTKTLDQVNGMDITLNPTIFHATKESAAETLSSSPNTANYVFAKISETSTHEWTLTAGTTNGRETRGNSGMFWYPQIGNQDGTYFQNGKFIHVQNLYYKDGDNWKEITRVGVDTYVNKDHYQDNRWTTERHEVRYVWVDQDVTVKRSVRKPASLGMGDAGTNGIMQGYWELGDSAVGYEGWRNQPVSVGFHTVTISLKKGWNQIETTTRYSDGTEESQAGWVIGEKQIRISAGIMGPFSSYDAANTANFASSSGKAYMTWYTGIAGTPTGIRAYSDEGRQIEVPWVVK